MFGPITALYRVADFRQALALANDSPYGLTASIHTRNIDRALAFAGEAHDGGRRRQRRHARLRAAYAIRRRKGLRQRTREPGTEALDIYSDLRDVYVNTQMPR